MFFQGRPMPPMAQMHRPSMFMQPFGMRPPAMNPSPKPGIGGLLKKIIPGIGKSAPTQGLQGMYGLQQFANPSSLQGMNPSTLQSLANPSNLTAIMGNVQKTLKMAESVVPMVQQYGPLVKNIPAMLKLYNEFKNSGDGESTTEENEEKLDINEVLETDNKKSKSKEVPTKSSGTGKSLPKLYV